MFHTCHSRGPNTVDTMDYSVLSKFLRLLHEKSNPYYANGLRD